MFQNIEIELLKRRITRKQLAEAIGISEGALRNKIKGRAEFTFSECKKIADLLDNLPWDYLFEQTEAGV